MRRFFTSTPKLEFPETTKTPLTIFKSPGFHKFVTSYKYFIFFLL